MQVSTLLSTTWSIDNTPAPAPRRKRVLTPEQLHINRLRSKEYYEAHKNKVLEKLRSNYASNRDKERERQREKYRRSKAKKMQTQQTSDNKLSQNMGGAECLVMSTTTATPSKADHRLAIQFLLNN
ncbi:hypothetical protein DYB37_010972 [Aphanomyces astaci]|uniref:Uncharacterized protein n=1 Tax=Aphanomyces astaci TaxID=112090 RepID=A0A3R6XFM2_APHAT|nr:hypothetical protein DYB35_011242 [Aphanomyces astaci]RHZ28775.1 hypothetical protein DYB37_010972 [Aphanomyces astaci]